MSHNFKLATKNIGQMIAAAPYLRDNQFEFTIPAGNSLWFVPVASLHEMNIPLAFDKNANNIYRVESTSQDHVLTMENLVLDPDAHFYGWLEFAGYYMDDENQSWMPYGGLRGFYASRNFFVFRMKHERLGDVVIIVHSKHVQRKRIVPAGFEVVHVSVTPKQINAISRMNDASFYGWHTALEWYRLCGVHHTTLHRLASKNMIVWKKTTKKDALTGVERRINQYRLKKS